jgi:beta-alanine degradation protein BauB
MMRDPRIALIPVAAFALLSAAAPDDKPLPTAFKAGWKGAPVCEPLFENATMRSARCTFPPGGGHDRHFHQPHWGYIVEGGTMRITDAGGARERVLKAGTNWWSDGIAWHEAVNIGSTTAVYIIVEPKPAP